MTDISASHFRTVAEATLGSDDHTVRTLSELLLQAARQLEKHDERRRDAAEMIGRLSARLDTVVRRDRGITVGSRVDI